MPLINRLQRDPGNQADGSWPGVWRSVWATASLAALWERLAFTDLLNFSSDYRLTALFWEMHVGGAALDGWLLLTVPFAIWALRNARTPVQHAISLGLIILAAYAALTTFSRGVYLALIVALPLLAWQTRMHAGAAGQRPEQPAWSPLRWAIALILLAAMAGLVFPGGGYRGLMALLGVIAVALSMPLALRNIAIPQLVAGALLGLMLGALLVLLAGFVPKGPYVLYFGRFRSAAAVPPLAAGAETRGSRRIYCTAGLLCAAGHRGQRRRSLGGQRGAVGHDRRTCRRARRRAGWGFLGQAGCGPRTCAGRALS